MHSENLREAADVPLPGRGGKDLHGEKQTEKTDKAGSTGADLRGCNTIEDLYNLIQTK